MTQFRVGDKVRFLNDVGGGVITKILDKEMVLVKNSDDWEIPTLMSELIADVASFFDRPVSRVEEEKPVEKTTKAVPKVEEPEKKEKSKVFQPSMLAAGGRQQKKSDGQFFLGFIPSQPDRLADSDMEAYMVNDSEMSMLYHYAIRFQGKWVSREAGLLEPDTKLFLEQYRREDLNYLTQVKVQFILFRLGEEFVPIPSREVELAIPGAKFFKPGSFVENDFFYEPALLFELKVVESVEPKVSDLEKAFQEKVEPRRSIARKPVASSAEVLFDTTEVDLHIEQLVSESAHLNNVEILGIQMDKFHFEMSKAIREGVRRVVFIHGVGNGVLKQEIAKELKHTYKHFQFQDASFKEYGYGATLVMLRK